MTGVDLIYDLIRNKEGIEPSKVFHIEDLIEEHPEEAGKYSSVYSLYEAEFDSGKTSKFITCLNSSAHIVLPATLQMLQDLFPDHVPKDGTPDQTETTS